MAVFRWLGAHDRESIFRCACCGEAKRCVLVVGAFMFVAAGSSRRGEGNRDVPVKMAPATFQASF